MMETIINKVYNLELKISNIIIKDSNLVLHNVKYIVIKDSNLNLNVVYDSIKNKTYDITINNFSYKPLLVPSSYSLILHPIIEYNIKETLIGYTSSKENIFSTGATLAFSSNSNWITINPATGVLLTSPNNTSTKRTAIITLLVSYNNSISTKTFTITLN